MAKQWSTQPDLVIDAANAYRATIRTNHGDITVELLADRAPSTVNNFVFLAREGFYDGVIFHRVIEGFMIQGGDPTGTGTGGPGYRFRDELDAARELGYAPGTLAMANAGPNTNGSQFFIMHRDNPLPPAYSVFGRTVQGLEVVEAIATTATDARDRPTEDVVITTVEIEEIAAT
jgi:cyclophilin family peptidyl-prolyl cis-trans isomerase